MTIPPGSPDDVDSPTELADTTYEAADPGSEATDLGDDSFEGRYQAGEPLGRGGMGEVRAFTDRRLGREVAVKLLHEHVAGSSDAVPRFLREARVQGQLQHPAVVPVYDLGIGPGDRPFLAMKRVSGETLSRTPALIMMALIAASFLFAPGLIIDSIMARIGDLERQVQLQVWQLRQLLPEGETN